MKSQMESIISVKGIEIDPESSQQIEAVISERRSEMESLPKTEESFGTSRLLFMHHSDLIIILLIFITFVGCSNEGH